jgi:hypothetical protein
VTLGKLSAALRGTALLAELLPIALRRVRTEQALAARVAARAPLLLELLPSHDRLRSLPLSAAELVKNLPPTLQDILLQVALEGDIDAAMETLGEHTLVAQVSAARRVLADRYPDWTGAWRPSAAGACFTRRTIRDNLLGGGINPRAQGALPRVDGALRAALAEAGALDEFLLLGLEAPAGEGGKNLSGGQRQKVAIARAVLKDPGLLILDEATANLDEISQATIYSLLRTRLADRTVLSVSHRLAPIKQFERVLVFDRGRVVQDGTYHQLATSDGLFRTLLAHERGAATQLPPDAPLATGTPQGERDHLRRWLALCPLFANLDGDQLAFLERATQVVDFEEGAVLFRRGEAGTTLYTIISGQVAFFVDTDGAARQILNVHGPGQSFGELAVFGDGIRTLGALAQTPLRLGLLERDNLLLLIRADPGFAIALLRTVVQRLADATDRLHGPAPSEIV